MKARSVDSLVPERLGHLLSIDCLWTSFQRKANVDIFWMHSFTCTNVKGSHLISPLGVIGLGYVLGPQTMISRGVRGGVLMGRPTDGWSERGV